MVCEIHLCISPLGGGLFLLAKSIHEIHNNLEGAEISEIGEKMVYTAGFASIIVQIAIIDIVFSLDSVITAVIVMMFSARAIGEFVDEHPTIKILALSFLILIGFMLMAEGLGQHIPKGYIYFAMAFSVAVEMINIRIRKKSVPVQLKRSMSVEDEV